MCRLLSKRQLLDPKIDFSWPKCGERDRSELPNVKQEPAAVLGTGPRRLGWEHERDTRVLWQGPCCLWLLCRAPRDQWVEPGEPCCLLGQKLSRRQSLPTLSLPACEPAGSLRLQPQCQTARRQHGQAELAAGQCQATGSSDPLDIPLLAGGW